MDPYSSSNIRVDEIIKSAKNSRILKNIIESNIKRFEQTNKNVKKNTTSSFLNNQNMLAIEGMHHVYYDTFVSAIEQKEKHYQKALECLTVAKDLDNKNMKNNS